MSIKRSNLEVGNAVHTAGTNPTHQNWRRHQFTRQKVGKGLAVKNVRSVTDMTTISIQIAEPRTLGERSGSQTLPTVSIWTRTMSWLRSTWCVINGGHYKVLHTEPDKLALRCVACGHQSPGWEVGAPRLARRMPADPDRLRARRAIAA